LRSISGGNWETSLAVATTNTAAFFSCIQLKKLPNTLDEVPPSVAPEDLLPLKAFSNSSIQASAVWMTGAGADGLIVVHGQEYVRMKGGLQNVSARGHFI